MVKKAGSGAEWPAAGRILKRKRCGRSRRRARASELPCAPTPTKVYWKSWTRFARCSIRDCPPKPSRESRLLIAAARNNPSVLALARCALSTALEMQGQYRESLAAVAMYESPESRAKLDQQAVQSLKVQIGLAYNYNGDHPKAISILKGALREFSESDAEQNTVRSMPHWPASIAASANIRLRSTMLSAPWNIFARPVNGADLPKLFWHWPGPDAGRRLRSGAGKSSAGAQVDWRSSRQLHARKNLRQHGRRLLVSQASQEGIRYLEKAIGYYERTDHKASAANGYNNLGINLILMGQWGRAQEALERALSLASEADERAEKVPMILDSLGELLMLRGELDEAETILLRAVALATEDGNKWYACQALRTLARCYLAMEDHAKALAKGEEALDLAEAIGDRQAICDSRLILAEAHLRNGEH